MAQYLHLLTSSKLNGSAHIDTALHEPSCIVWMTIDFRQDASMLDAGMQLATLRGM